MNIKSGIPNQVTVVIPAYNEEKFIREALDSVVNQVDCVLIGDNASTDATEKICREYAVQYPHISYFRHAQNIGSLENQKFLFGKVETEFCFQMGAHDLVPSDYIAELLLYFRQNSDAVAIYADCHKIDENHQTFKRVCYGNVYDVKTKMYFPQLLTSDIPQRRIIAFLLNVNYTYLIFGLFRSEFALKSWGEVEPIAGCDEVALYHAALSGKFIYCPKTYFQLRNVHQNDSYKKYMQRIIGHAAPAESVSLSVSLPKKKDYTPCVTKIRDLYNHIPISVGFENEARTIFKRLCFRFANKADVYSGIFSIDFYLWCKKVRKFFFDIRLSRGTNYVKLFGVVFYNR